MAVKKHELVHDNCNQVDLIALKQYVQLLNVQPNYLPPPSELVKHCQDIVKCLARAKGTEEELWELINSIEEFLMRILEMVTSAVRHEIVTAILDKFYSLISDPESNACPVTSIVLFVLTEVESESILSAARWLVQQDENGPGGAGLRASLTCLFRWATDWHGTPALGHWIMAYIKALEENERFDILMEVSIDNIGRLFLSLTDPTLRQAIADVIFHVLSSLRESTDAFDKISPYVNRVLTNLATDSGQWSRQLLQNVVEILSATVEGLLSDLTGDAEVVFKTKYNNVISCLERHMASRGSFLLQLQPWRKRNVCITTVNPHTPPMRKVGLLNLGNTCYMNSVMQALLVTRQFSNHVIVNMTAVPYWAKMGVLFANMTHSLTNKLNPEDFFVAFKPSFFTQDHQHDSSEFLGYVFELLQSYEHCSDRNFDYTRAPVLRTASRLRYLPYAPAAHANGTDNDANGNRRSTSPRPGSSRAGSSSSGNKRSAHNAIDLGPNKKRMRHYDSVFLRRDSYIDNMFGGVLLTRVECVVCRSSSISRDVFRDLQLAFPEKPEGWQYSVQNLLEYYCSKERMSGENKYQCRDCGQLRDAEKSVIIEATPKYLILVLKNFKFEAKLQVLTKLMLPTYHNHTVTLPTVRSQAEHAQYTLYAAIIHNGTTLDSGHYYTLANDNGQWHTYNDEVVAEAHEGHLFELSRASTPYILFYRRKDITESAAPAMDAMPPKLQEIVMAHNKNCVETVRQLHISRP